METGSYTILLELDQPSQISFGAAGQRCLDEGWYAYTGSAFGPGGLSRVERHRRVYEGENSTRHWHIDYLLGDSTSSWDDVWMTTADVECQVVSRLPGDLITGIGATDCECASHLNYHSDRSPLVTALAEFYGRHSKVTHSEGD